VSRGPGNGPPGTRPGLRPGPARRGASPPTCPRPRLRPVEAFPIDLGGRRLIALRDPVGIAERIVTVSAELAVVLSRCDGSQTLDDLLAAHVRETGLLLARADLERVVGVLDREGFLESPAFAARKAALAAAYRATPHRPPAHAGVSYPEGRAALASRLAALEREADRLYPDGSADPRAPVAIVAPHIDLRVGGAAYVPAYRALRAAGGADLAVVLGVGHSGVPGLFAASGLDFATPLGVAPTDRAFVADLSEAFGADLTEEEFVHRGDHTIEFQVLYLQRFLGPACRVVAVLCGFGYGDALGDGDAAGVERFAAALAGAVARRRAGGERVVLIASADLAHVGPRYGDEAPLDPAALAEVERADREALDAVATGNARAFLARIAAARDRYRVCGFAPIYTTLLAAGARRGRLLAYGMGPTDGAGSLCSYASLALYPD
jgi:AmmeMemoRadiSam system protein B